VSVIVMLPGIRCATPAIAVQQAYDAVGGQPEQAVDEQASTMMSVRYQLWAWFISSRCRWSRWLLGDHQHSQLAVSANRRPTQENPAPRRQDHIPIRPGPAEPEGPPGLDSRLSTPRIAA